MKEQFTKVQHNIESFASYSPYKKETNTFDLLLKLNQLSCFSIKKVFLTPALFK